MILTKLNINYKNKLLSPILIFVSLTFMVVALSGPMILEGYVEVKNKGLDIYFVFDVSKSMLADDIKPNRLERGKKIMNDITDHLDGDRVGIIPFSGSSFVQLPLTNDYSVLKMFMNVLDTNMISGGGSNILSGIKLAKESLNNASIGDNVVIVISDGEENEGSIEELKNTELGNIKIYTVGIGTNGGSVIPIYNDKGEISSYVESEDGTKVVSKLVPDTLIQIASIGGGKYYQSTSMETEIKELVSEIKRLKRSEYQTKVIKEYKRLYQYFLLLGLVLFLLSYFVIERRKLN